MTAFHIAVALLVPILMCGCYDTVTSRYETRADAEADRIFERGWLPRIIPKSSYKIIARNELDINISEGEFYFEPGDANDFIRHLTASDNGSTYSFTHVNTTWLFEVNTERSHCNYAMRPHRQTKHEQ